METSRSRNIIVILALSLMLNIALTSIIIALNIKYSNLEQLVDQLTIEVNNANNVIRELQSKLNYTNNQLEYYKSQLEYFISKLSEGYESSIIGKSTVNIVAVRAIQEDYFTIAYEGIVMKVEVELTPGDGKILVNTKPNVGIDLQTSVRIAVTAAEKYTGVKLGGTNIIVSIIASREFTIVDGPSAGAAITIAIISAITGKNINETVYVTGTINSDGNIGQVGGILEKAIAAAKNGCKLFLVPKGQLWIQVLTPVEKEVVKGFKIVTYQYKIVNVEEQLRALGYNVRVIEVRNVNEAIKYMLIQV